MKKKFKWGIVGTGGIANAFTQDLIHLKNHKVISVLSRNIHTAKNFASKILNCKPYDNEKLFFEDKNIDAIYIATPNTLHAPQSIKAL